MDTVSIVGISGSLRRDSYNTALLNLFGELAPPEIIFSVFDAVDVPVFNVDVEAQGDPDSVIRLRRAIADADGVLFATPEYNGGIPGSMKNIIDWASRGESPISKKPCAVIGGGGRFGTAHAQMMLRHTLTYMGCPVLPGQNLYVPMVRTKFEDGKLTDERARQHLEKLGTDLLEWVTRISRPPR